ncbi:MAG TPA: hypothetical protein VFP60_12190 [Pseudolabrys sp.]|nr:hypothetical protein [Pseudolabrys sp.]
MTKRRSMHFGRNRFVCGFPKSDNIALLAVEVDTVKAWTKPASLLTYAHYYLRGSGDREVAVAEQVAQQEIIRTAIK